MTVNLKKHIFREFGGGRIGFVVMYQTEPELIAIMTRLHNQGFVNVREIDIDLVGQTIIIQHDNAVDAQTTYDANSAVWMPV